MMALKSKTFSQFLKSFTALITLTCLTFIGLSAASADNPPRKIFGGWLPYYGIARGLPAAATNSDMIKEVSPFWYTLSSATSIKDLYTPANPSTPISYSISTLRSFNFTILPTITDGTKGGVLAGIIANPQTRTQLVSTITNLVLSNNYDGIELDFENFAFVDPLSTWPTTQPNWVSFIQQLSTSLHANNKLLAIDSPVLFDPTTGHKGYSVYAWAQIAPFIDRLRIMGYDYSIATPGPIGPINWETDSIKYAISVMPASKVFLGIPGYGRNWTTKVVGVCPADVAPSVSVKAPAATFVQYNAPSLAQTLGVTPTYNSKYAEATFTYTKVYNGYTATNTLTSCTQTGVVWYQNPDSFVARAALVGTYHLGGIMEWTLGFEDPAALAGIRQVAISIAPDKVISTLMIDKSSINIGDVATISAHVAIADTTPIANTVVHLQQSNSRHSWQTIADGTTNSLGDVVFKAIFGQDAQLRIITDESWTKAASISTSTAISVKAGITISSSSSTRVNFPFVISGELTPAIAGASITISGGDLAAPITTSTGPNGIFAISLTNSTRGFAQYQISTSPNSELSSVASVPLTVLVR